MSGSGGRSPIVQRQLCGFCGRKFAEDIIERHLSICKMIKYKSRNIFDSGVQRMKKNKFPDDEGLKSEEVSNHSRKNNWRRKHLDFLNILKSKRRFQSVHCPANFENDTKQHPVDHKMCLFCKRFFQEEVADRHMPFCKDLHRRMTFKGPKIMKTHKRVPEYEYSKMNRTFSRDNLNLDCFNNSSLHSVDHPPRILRQRKPANTYKKTLKEITTYFAVSRIPKVKDFIETRSHLCKQFLRDDRVQGKLSCLSSISKRKECLADQTSQMIEPVVYDQKDGFYEPLAVARFCFHCGFKYESGNDNFCYNCGTGRLVLDDEVLM